MNAEEIINKIEQLPQNEWQKLQDFLDLNQWQISQIKQAVAAADRGEFATNDEVEETVTRLTS